MQWGLRPMSDGRERRPQGHRDRHCHLREAEGPPRKRLKETKADSQDTSGCDLWLEALRRVAKAGADDEPPTLAKLAESLQRLRGPQGGKAGEEAFYVAVSLLATGYLREEFKHSPYSTNAYLVATLKGQDALAARAPVSQETRQRGTPPPLLFEAPVLGPVAAAAQAAASVRAGGGDVAASGAAAAAAAVSTARRLRRLRAALGERHGVPTHFVLTDEEVAALAALRPPPAAPAGLTPLCGAKRRLYGEDVLGCLRGSTEL